MRVVGVQVESYVALERLVASIAFQLGRDPANGASAGDGEHTDGYGPPADAEHTAWTADPLHEQAHGGGFRSQFDADNGRGGMWHLLLPHERDAVLTELAACQAWLRDVSVDAAPLWRVQERTEQLETVWHPIVRRVYGDTKAS